MASTNLSIKYRPVKIGFLVRDGSVEDLVKASGINTLLWGGIYNPIIPVSADKEFAEQLMDLFSVDVLFPVSQTKEIDNLIKEYPFLKAPMHYNQNIFYEDYRSKKNNIGYLDSLNIVNYYWDKELKYKPKAYQSKCISIIWEENEELKHFFSILFGYFPTDYNLRDNFENAFLKGMRSKVVYISINSPINKELVSDISPIRLTASELIGYGGTWRGNGVFVGDENDFNDLLYFWNLRASGLLVEFLPKNKIERFREFTREFIKKLDSIPTINPNIEDWICVYYRTSRDEVGEIIKEFQGKKRFRFNHCDKFIWNGLNIKPSEFYFGWQNILGNVDKSHNRFTLSASLPEKRFIVGNNRDTALQHLVVSISPIIESAYPEHTLKLPFIRQLNEFYSREIAFDPWKIRIEKDGIGEVIQVTDNYLFLHPIAHQTLMKKVFNLAGIEAEISPAGLLTSQIVHNMREEEPLEACRVFKIKGVRKLIKYLRSKNFIKWNEGLRIIGQDNFNKFKKLYIESRSESELKPQDALTFLLKKKILIPKLKLWNKLLRKQINYKCKKCGLGSKVILSSFEGYWSCHFCDNDEYMPSYIGLEFRKHYSMWRFKRGSLFAKDDDQMGAIPVILTLLVFKRIFDASQFIYSPSLNLKIENKPCEVDFVVLQYKRGEKIQMGVGECKDENQKIDQNDIDNLKSVRAKISSLGIDCYLVFSKAAEEFDKTEIGLFKELKRLDHPFILLTNKELEPYHPYWEIEGAESLPQKYALDMMGMFRNSEHLYLKDKEK
jgi:hypothetical protein